MLPDLKQYVFFCTFFPFFLMCPLVHMNQVLIPRSTLNNRLAITITELNFKLPLTNYCTRINKFVLLNVVMFWNHIFLASIFTKIFLTLTLYYFDFEMHRPTKILQEKRRRWHRFVRFSIWHQLGHVVSAIRQRDRPEHSHHRQQNWRPSAAQRWCSVNLMKW